MSWEQLLDIGREAAALRQADESGPPVACPNDGEPLERGPNGVLHCSFDGWTSGQ
jgi:hypothetical protein